MIRKIILFVFLCSSIILSGQEICNNGIDDDADGLIDCYDPQCSGAPACDSFFYNNPIVYCKYIPPPANIFEMDALWTSTITVDARTTMVTGDIDADGIPEVICYTPGNLVQVLDGKTGATKLSITTTPINIQYDGPAIADTDNDGLGEIYVITDDMYLRCFEDNGTPKAGFTPPLTSGNREYSQSIADFNGDGIPEIYIGHEIFNSLTGALIATAGAAASNGANGNNGAAYPVAADVLPTGFCADCAGLELICGNEVYSVNIATGTMTLQTSAPASLADGFTSIADYNKDGGLDVVVSTKGNIYAWDPRTGLQIGTTYTIPGTTQGGHANIADYDGNGWPEIGVGGQGIFVVLNDYSTGTGLNLKWSKAIKDPSGRTTCTSFDFEGDGQIEIIYRDEDTLYIWEGATGNVKASTPCTSGTRTEYPIVVDVDADMQANIVCACGGVNGKVWAFKSKTQPWVSTRKVMNQHSYFAVNINDDLTIPINQQNHALIPTLNTFLNQPPVTDQTGNPIFIPAADVYVRIDTAIFPPCTSNPTSVNITLTLCDTGYVIAPKGMKVSFYNGDPLSGGTLITTDTTTSSIGIGGCITQIFTIPYSASFNLHVYANDKGTSPLNAPELSFIECDSTNNSYTKPIAAPPYTPPSPVISGTTTICTGTATTLTASGGDTYSWNTGATTTSITVSPASDTTYTVTATYSGCTGSTSVTVSVTPNIVPVITGTTTLCPGAGTTLTATGGSSYTWNTGATTSTISVSPTVNTSYSVTVTNGSCSGTATVQVTINTPPLPTITGITTICSGTNTILTAAGGDTYLWDNSATTTAITVNPVSNTTYTVTATAAGCTGTASVAVTVNPNPAPSIGGTTTICAGTSTVLTATGGGTYSWSTAETTSAITVSPPGNTTYTVTVTNAGCTGSASIAVTVAANLNPTIVGNNTVCNGSSTTLSTSGGGTYSWSTTEISSSIIVTPPLTTTYSVTVSNGLCSGTASILVTVVNNPVPTISGNTTLCEGQNTMLIANSGGTYNWSTGDTTAGITIAPTAGTSNYTVTVTTNGCTGSATIQVTVNPTPQPTIAGITTICSGQNTALTVTATGAYSWNTGETTSSITVNPATNSTYSVTVTSNNCSGSATAEVTVVPPVSAAITGNDICLGENVTLTASGGNNYLWSTGDTVNPLTDNPVVTTTYTVIASVGNCADTATYIVTVNPLPVAIISGDTSISYGNSTLLNASGGGTYLWTPSSGLNCSTCENPVATPAATTQYCVTITDSFGCIDSACLTVTIDLKCGDNGELYVPNGFSPNGDGQNDVLYIRGGGITGVYWAIFDRWGEKVFETVDPKQGWDGTYIGKQLDPAVFVYFVQITCYSGENIIQKGNVAIIK